MATYTVDQEFVNNLLDIAEENGIEYTGFEGVLLNNYIIYTNKEIRVGGRRTKYIIIKEVTLNEWSSDYELILTDSNKKAETFISECEVVENEQQEEVAEVEVITEKTVVKEWYSKTFPHDELAQELDENVTFKNVFEALDDYEDVYKTLGVDDSLVRERVFMKLSDIMEVDYNYIYDQWLLAV